MSHNPFGPDVIEAIKHHMNEDHADDSLLIIRALGGQPEATAATMTGFDGEGADFEAVVGGRQVPVRLPWNRPITERPHVRQEVVRMYEEARLALEPDAASGP